MRRLLWLPLAYILTTASMCQTTSNAPPPPTAPTPAVGCSAIVPYTDADKAALSAQIEAQESQLEGTPIGRAVVEYAGLRAAIEATCPPPAGPK